MIDILTIIAIALLCVAGYLIYLSILDRKLNRDSWKRYQFNTDMAYLEAFVDKADPKDREAEIYITNELTNIGNNYMKDYDRINSLKEAVKNKFCKLDS